MSRAYEAVSLVEKAPWDDDYADSTISESEHELVPTQRKNNIRSKIKANSIWLVHLLLLTISGLMFIGSLVAKPSTTEFVKEFTAWSPAQEAVEYQTVKYNITTENNRYVGKGPDVDAAWLELHYNMGDQMITPAQLAQLGLPETMIKVNNPRTGESGYRIGLEVFHHLHCLNLLRRVTHKDYYTEKGMLDDEEELSHHTAHCIEVLRLNLQCQADVGVFTLYYKDGDPLAWPELNTEHRCRNFDRIRDWAMDNSVGIMKNG